MTMKRILPFLLVLSLLAAPALADPLAIPEDYEADICEPYDENDPSAGAFTYSCRYPHVDTSAEGGAGINSFYEYMYTDTLSNMVPMLQDAYEYDRIDFSMNITYTVTCNNDDFFSVLLRTEKKEPEQDIVYWEGHVFSRKDGKAGYTYTLPMLLGILNSTESEEWIQDYQTEKADELVRDMVWDMIEENEAGIDYGGLTREDLTTVFFPEESFYLDENGDPVFYMQPGDIFEVIPEGMDLLIFPIPLEDILDEL